MTRPVVRDLDECVLGWLLSPDQAEIPDHNDDLFTRLVQAWEGPDTGDLDLAVLVRQLLRRWSLRDGRRHTARTAPALSRRLRGATTMAGLSEHQVDVWSADPWRPDWLGDDPGIPDGAAGAGTGGDRQYDRDDLPADPFFYQCTAFEHYRTPGQRAASRAVVSVPAGSTVICMLPTGSGKTEVALCLADQHKNAVTLIVVPTVALAYDFERRFRKHYARLYPRAKRSELHFAWTASTPDDLRERLRTRIREGNQPILVTSPESLAGALQDLLRDAAAAGRIGGFVIDEAHLVTQWGRDFRPEYRTLSSLRDDLAEKATRVGHDPPTTLLLSATLGAFELRDLHRLFAQSGPSTLIAANALRTEPEVWMAAAADQGERKEWVMEALAHLPRPAVLYVTRPETAELWLRQLRHAGYQRLALVTGRTNDDERSKVLADLRSDDDRPSQVDLVVANSAFGLGIDYPHFRTVIHACMPETVDRWYQELGRGGRDGHASAALLLTAPGDRKEAESLTTKVLTAAKASRRWKGLWTEAKHSSQRRYVDLESSTGHADRGSYNRRWNAQLVQGLVELEAIQRFPVESEDLAHLQADIGEEARDWVGVFPLRSDLHVSDFWTQTWAPWQQQEWSRSRYALDAMTALARGQVCACEAIARSYRADEQIRSAFGDASLFTEPVSSCGRCPGCRRRRLRVNDDPPPDPPQRWPVAEELMARLGDLADAANAQDRLILLTTDDLAAVTAPLAWALIRRGVRHLAGPVSVPSGYRDWLFTDPEPVSPARLTPCSAFVVYPPGRHVPGSWLSLAPRKVRQNVFDVLLLPAGSVVAGQRVGRDRPALNASTALQVLGG